MGEVSEEYLWVAREREGGGGEREREEARGKQREGDTLKKNSTFHCNLHSTWCVMCSGAISISSKNKSLLKTFWGFSWLYFITG